ncbi:hypothetical protein CS060_08005 [Anoxybacillus flavithermus]|uniref:Uncharacterized protein n=1 Tax=Anoxybacillus flavithermus TaxID=33934 RepID=A0A2G5RQ60_9BACL|nr:hypothetical protein [Anoxybacillus flavithermus]KFZ42495.1 hypothetical protein JS80_09745 [Anoxybacillus sp. KU2-6(11)]PIC04791.1 hypothetical protein CS060_08005 [Anoxybacillus flavithermus]
MPYLFFAIFFLILIPIYIRLPFGWTKKGIALVLTVACLLSAFGMIAVEQFPLWQAVLFLLLLVIASTYLLEQKLGHLFYARVHEHDLIVENDEIDEPKDERPSSTKETIKEQQGEEIRQEVETINEEWLETAWTEEVEQQVSIEPLREADYDHMIKPITNMDDVIEPLHMIDSDVSNINEATEDIIQERWDDLLSEENNVIHERKMEEESDLLDIESLTVAEETIDHVIDESYDLESIAEDDAIYTVDEQQNEDMSVIDIVEQQPSNEETIGYVAEERGIQEKKIETVTTQENHEALRTLPKPFMKNLLASLSAMRPLLSDEEYEQLIYKHLHPRLHEQDYYTFANVLMEHYVASKQYEKLYDVAKQLYGQYELYPMIQQQLAHMIHYAEQKMGWKK